MVERDGSYLRHPVDARDQGLISHCALRVIVRTRIEGHSLEDMAQEEDLTVRNPVLRRWRGERALRRDLDPRRSRWVMAGARWAKSEVCCAMGGNVLRSRRPDRVVAGLSIAGRPRRADGRTGPVARAGGSMARTALLIAALVTALASACSGSDAAIPAGTTTTRSPRTSVTSGNATTTTRAAASAEADITRRYKAFWDARFAANEAHASSDESALGEYAIGAQLENVIDETRRNRSQGHAFRKPESSVAERRVKVLDIIGDVAHLQDCATTDGIVYRVADGSVIDDTVVTQSVEATMRQVDGTWKIESARLLQEWKGVAGCALAP